MCAGVGEERDEGVFWAMHVSAVLCPWGVCVNQALRAHKTLLQTISLKIQAQVSSLPPPPLHSSLSRYAAGAFRPVPTRAHLAYVPLVLHRAVRVLCNSEATAREVHQRLGVPAKRLVPIRLGFSPGLLRPLGLKRQPFFLVLGRHDPHKNLERVLRAFAGLRDRDHRLALVGPQDPRYTPRLRRLASELGIAGRCDWHHWVSDQERLNLLNRCRGLVMASLWEGFGLPALEGMACGAPVIAAEAGALPEVVGEAALRVDPRSVAAICAAMDELIHSTWLEKKLSDVGPIRAQRFSWQETGVQVEAVLQSLL